MKVSKFAVIGVLGLLICCAPPSDSSGTEHPATLETSEDGEHAKQTTKTEPPYFQLTHLAVFTYVWGPAAWIASPRDADKAVRFWFGEKARNGPSHGSIRAKTVDLGESETDRGRAAVITAPKEAEYLEYGQAKDLPLRALEAKLGFSYVERTGRMRASTTFALECDGKPHKRDLVAPGVLESPAAEELRRGLVVTYVCSRIDAVQDGFAACARADRDCHSANTPTDPSEDGRHATQTTRTEPAYQLTHLTVFTYVWGSAEQDTAPRDADKSVRFWFGKSAKNGPAHGSIRAKTVDLGESETDWGRVGEITATQETNHLKHGQAKNLPLRALEPKLAFAYFDRAAARDRSRTTSTLDCDGKLHQLDLVAPSVLTSPKAGELRRGLVVTYVCSRIEAVQNGFAACARADQDCDGAITLADLDGFAVDLHDEERSSVFDDERLDGVLGIFDDCAGYRGLAFSPDWGSWGRRGPI